MHVAPARRHDLYEHARSSWGQDTAETLMEMLPPDIDDLVRRSDLEVFRAEIRAEFAEFRAEMHADFAAFRAEMHAELSALTRTFYLAMVTSMLTTVGLSFTVAHFA